ncbi:SDR family NAD(P)-dependent oxidoreductase [Sphingobium boeckii]|uniref:2-hydroxycyclohexanecarboxyl-CoA dehydrogenase n=1 Tax=Sphingobium boeckii TaxID=1082345 RepID=A0A7W9AI75_9SPHN|nr:3-oxoacyl-ACP reductase family protein [Sphingobium boeckii]MBB5685961.1 2-hydroxycyclohexanecarboxyl-CoA dehydrogenase [Sphingobium boeckii]
MSLKGKIAVVTGAARGLGRAISLRLAQGGAAISVWDLNGAGAEETARMIREAGGSAIAVQANSAKADEIARGVAQTHAELGPVSILVNNAALSPFVPFQDITEEIWDDLMAINLKGPFLCCKAIIPDMLAAGWGRIINISSSSAQTGAPAMAHYVASKGGVIGFTKALAMEYANSGITVNNVPPGFVNTEGLREAPVNIDAFAPTTPMKRPGRPENIAAAVAYLASDDADYVTGHTLSVNGGRYLG